jgi:hypothetical protein
MGVSRLKKKIELNYRRGRTWQNCSECDHFVSHYLITGPGKAGRGFCSGPRCRVMGLKGGRAYRVSPDGLCDAFDNTEKLARLGVNRDE